MSTTTPTSAAPDVIRLENVSKEFVVRKDNTVKERVVHFGRHGRLHRESYTAVDDVTYSIPAGTTVGLLGPNGSGKSTLLKLIGGIVSPTSGKVATRGRMAALLELGAGFHPDLSGRENVYLNAAIMGLSRAETEAQFEDILEFSGIGEFIDTQVKFYSSGMFVRLAFAVAVHTDPDVLLVDEVLAVGDEAFQRKCMDRIARFRAEGRTIVLVSHSASQVAELCDVAVVLDNGRIVFSGDTNDGISALRDVLDGRAVGEVASDEDDGELAVKRVEILDADGRALDEVVVGSAITIRVHLRSRGTHKTWSAGFSIDTPNGQMVLAANTERLGFAPEPLEAGDRVLDFDLASANFGPGQYSVNASVASSVDGSSDVLWQGARLNIVGNDENFGTVWAEVTAR